MNTPPLGLYEIVNPSDPITVKASPEHAAVLATILRHSWFFLNPVGESASLPSLPAEEFSARRNRMDGDAADLAAYAAVFLSATVGKPGERAAIDAMIEALPESDQVAARRRHNEARRSSMNDIAGQMIDAGEKLAAQAAAMREGAKP